MKGSALSFQEPKKLSKTICLLCLLAISQLRYAIMLSDRKPLRGVLVVRWVSAVSSLEQVFRKIEGKRAGESTCSCCQGIFLIALKECVLLFCLLSMYHI